MVELNFTFFVFTASFIVFIGLMKLVFFDPLNRVIVKREEFIASNIRASKKAQKNIEDQIAEADAASILIKARQEAQKILSKAIDEASQKKAGLVSKAISDNKDIISRNIRGLENEEHDISQNLSSYITEITNTAISQLMSEIEGKQKATV